MQTRIKRAGLFVTALSIFLVLGGCGSSGDGTGVGSDPTIDPTFVPVSTGYNSPDAITAEGGFGGDGDGDGGVGAGGALGKFADASITIDLDNGDELGTAAVGTDGLVTARPPSGYSGPLFASVIGTANSTYFDEDKLAYVPTGTGTILRVAVPRVTKHIGITALTNAAVRYLETRVEQGLDFSVEDPDAISAANARVLAEINRFLPSTNQLTDITILPIMVGSEAELKALPPGARGNYARAVAAFSVLAAKFTPTLTAPGLTFAENLARDLTDGVIDDKDIDGEPLAPGRDGLAYQSPTLAAELETALSDLRVVTATIRDSGSVADDAFSVALDGNVVCTTTIGAQNSCTLGELPPGTYELTVTATIAPDNLGTYTIEITSPNMTIDGQTSFTGTLRPQGASRTFALVVTSPSGGGGGSPTQQNFGWKSAEICQGITDPNYAQKWSVSLRQDGATVTGDLFFHACPGGGRLAFSLSGSAPSAGQAFSLTGTKLDGAGPLGSTLLNGSTQSFTLTRDQSPVPNLAP